MFVNQINGTSVGFTIFNLFVIDKSALLTVRNFFFSDKDFRISNMCHNVTSSITDVMIFYSESSDS